MGVTELALLTLKASNTEEALEGLRQAAKEQAAYSKYSVVLLQSREQEQDIYLVGGWDSIEEHMKDWIPSPTNQKLLESLGPYFDMKWMFHIQAQAEKITNFLADSNDETIVVARHGIRSDDRAAFNETWVSDTGELKSLNKARQEAGHCGWRLDDGVGPESERAKDENELVLFAISPGLQNRADLETFENSKQTSTLGKYLEQAHTGFVKLVHVQNSDV